MVSSQWFEHWTKEENQKSFYRDEIALQFEQVADLNLAERIAYFQMSLAYHIEKNFGIENIHIHKYIGYEFFTLETRFTHNNIEHYFYLIGE